MRGVAQRARIAHRRHLLVERGLGTKHVQQRETRTVAAERVRHRTDHELLGAQAAPVAEVHQRRIIGSLQHVAPRQRFEQAGARQVRFDDLRHIHRHVRSGLERHHGNRSGADVTTADREFKLCPGLRNETQSKQEDGDSLCVSNFHYGSKVVINSRSKALGSLGSGSGLDLR